jgi:hypothetical protein
LFYGSFMVQEQAGRSSRRRAFASTMGLAFVAALATGCAPKSSPPPAAPSPPPPPPAHTVSAVVLVNGCARLGVQNAKLAQSAMNQLVDGCGSFTGGRVQFSATLLPGGAIQFVQGPDPAQAIPVCVLTHPLTHKVHLQTACTLDVRLEEGSVDVPKTNPTP